jgi:hypothetical protein
MNSTSTAGGFLDRAKLAQVVRRLLVRANFLVGWNEGNVADDSLVDGGFQLGVGKHDAIKGVVVKEPRDIQLVLVVARDLVRETLAFSASIPIFASSSNNLASMGNHSFSWLNRLLTCALSPKRSL